MEKIDGMITGSSEFKIFTGLLKASRSGDGKMRLHGVASSTTKDLHGDIMTQSAIDDMEAAANRNLTIFLNHSYEVPEDVGGSVEKARSRVVGVDADGNPNIDLDFDIVINDANPRAVQAFEAIERGTKLGLSIGAMIPENGAKRTKGGSFIIEHVDLLETSIVGIPANPRSWVEYAVKGLRSKSLPIVDEAEPEIVEAAPEVETIDVEVPVEETIPEVTDATVTVETPFANVTVDTDDKPSQEAAESDPETEVLDETAEGDDETLGDTQTRSLDDIDVSRALSETLNLLRSTTRELIEARASLAEAQTAKAVAERERDAARTQRDTVLAGTQQILDRVANSPLARRAVAVDAKRDFRSRFEGIYDDEFLKMIERGNDD